jgi:hypothetical protein
MSVVVISQAGSYKYTRTVEASEWLPFQQQPAPSLKINMSASSTNKAI